MIQEKKRGEDRNLPRASFTEYQRIPYLFIGRASGVIHHRSSDVRSLPSFTYFNSSYPKIASRCRAASAAIVPTIAAIPDGPA